MEHRVGIEGFNTVLICVPDKRICAVVLANLNEMAPREMGRQRLDVVLGKPVPLAVPIAIKEL